METSVLSVHQKKMYGIIKKDSTEFIFNSKNFKSDNSVEEDIEFAIKINRWLLSPLGIWPHLSEPSFIEKFTKIVTIIICSLLMAFIIIPGSLFTFVQIKDPAVRLKLTGALSFCVMGIMKYCSLVLKHQDITNCFNYIIFDWHKVNSVSDREIMIKYAQFGRYGSIICAIFMYGGGLFYAGILPHVSASVKNEHNITIRPLAYPSYYIFFDPQESPAYEITFSIHCCCAFVMHSITSAACSLAVVFVMHACGQLEILIGWLNDLVEGKRVNQGTNDRFSNIIKQHVKTLRFIACTENVLCEICLVEVVGCTLNICFLGYYLMLEWEQADAIGITTYTILLISFTFNIFLFCYIGELLREECRKVGETSYMIDWYQLPEKKALGLKLTIATAQNPVTVTAGKLVELSLHSFCTEWSQNDAGGMTTYILLLISFIFNIFLYCYIGELLTDKCLQVYNAAYYVDWYDLPNKLAYGTVLTILISQNSNPIRAGKLINLSLYTFGTIIRTSLAYLNILRNFMDSFLFLPGVYLIKLVNGIGVKFRLGGPISFCTMAMIKYFSLLTGLDNLKKCFSHLITDWHNVTCPHDRDIMIKRSQQGHFGASVCALFMSGGALFYALILPNISGGDKSISNVTARPVAYPSHFGFFDAQASPAYEIVFFIHCCCSFTMHSIASVVCGIAIVLIMHACGQLEVISLSMEKLGNDTSEIADVEKRFSQILQHHVRTLSYINNVDQLLCNICLVDVMGCSLNLCVVGSGLILQWGHFDAIGIITYFLLVTSFVLNIFVFCYIGELLTEQCEEVGKKLYMINWYDLPRKNALHLILTIFMAQRPVILTAGKFFDLSLNSFCAVSLFKQKMIEHHYLYYIFFIDYTSSSSILKFYT
ncbi:LOW QUALITY PROTEIN: uncharacterized protein [Chelonus insularis]|uniref:LOW QUALITY PROTEIN: uncharacterized protein n=1 Tax=Chelonus insularis TaxID=460826 RepID=UPI00158970EC|nr:LOW QUALITY PROTEIN: uncharacterized protein LOC118070206 [Chelonus insularis]